MRIAPATASAAPGGPPPRFQVETDGLGYFAVQLAGDRYLFNAAGAGRRSRANWFDSWYGDDREPAGPKAAPREVAGVHLEARTGRAEYSVPPAAWKRLAPVPKPPGPPRPVYYRLLAFADARRGGARASFDDVNWDRAPALSVAVLPVVPPRSPAGAFLGKNVLDRADFIEKALPQVRKSCVISGRDRDLHYVLMDARCIDMTVVECHDRGLTDTIAAMPDAPDAIVNGQFIAAIFGVGTEGQVVREGELVNADSQPARLALTQDPAATDVSGLRVAAGNPRATRPAARAGFGGLGPVLQGGAPPATLSAWAKSIHDMPKGKGRGVIAIRRDLGLVLVLVQRDAASTNPLTMQEMRELLQRLRFDDAVFNDGSDSEALFAGKGWSLRPGYAKDEAMDFAIGFVDRKRVRRASVLVIDGTKTEDGSGFAGGVHRPSITHYSAADLAPELVRQAAIAPLAPALDGRVLKVWKATTAAQNALIRQIVTDAGAGGRYADLMYVSSHAWRHGQLWFHPNDDVARGTVTIAHPWQGFRPRWNTTPRWLVLAGCAVLGLRYARGLALGGTERRHLVDWHREIWGAGATVPGLTPATRVLYAVYHPGWAWASRVFAACPGLRGVLGYWYRSPSQEEGSSRQVDAEIATDFARAIAGGEPFLSAWESANRRTFLSYGHLYRGQAPWAAMVRPGCEADTAAVLEKRTVPPVTAGFNYYDGFQRGAAVRAAYATANARPEVAEIGALRVRHNPSYDATAIDELKAVAAGATAATFLAYDDGVAP